MIKFAHNGKENFVYIVQERCIKTVTEFLL